MNRQKKSSVEDWYQLERQTHDFQYLNSKPFDSEDYHIDPKHIIWWQDYCYLPGRRLDRGHRTKRVFEIMDLERIHDKTILDVGCGNGQYSVFFAMLGAKVYAFDISPIGIKVAQEIAKVNGVEGNCFFSVQSASKINYPNEFFDIVLFHEVLHHTIKYPGVKDETYRVLKKGGRVICADGLTSNILIKIGTVFTMKGKEGKGDVHITIEDLKNFSKGFTTYEIELMSLFFMSKRLFKNHLNNLGVRKFLFFLKRLDDALLKYFPFFKKYCSECILIIYK